MSDRKIFPPRLNSHRLIGVFWVALVVLDVLIIAMAIPGYQSGWGVYLSPDFQDSPQAMNAIKAVSISASLFCAALSMILAAILFFRKRQDSMAVFVSFYLLLYGVAMGGPLEAAFYSREIPNLLGITIQSILMTTPTIFLLSVFPTGQFVPKWTIWLVLASIPLNLWILIFNPGQDLFSSDRVDTVIIGAWFFLSLMIASYAQYYRYRYVSNQVQRVQTRWVLAGFILWIGYMAVSSIPYYTIQNIAQPANYPWWAPLSSASWWLSLNILPIALTIAILRSRLFDIDLFIRRTLVYSVLTGLLVLIYFGSVVLFQGFFYAITQRESPLSIVLSTLAIAGLFNPLRIRIQEFIDRRFFRQKYNSAQALASFAKTARDEVELHVLSNALLGVVQENLQPESVNLWLVEAGQETPTVPDSNGKNRKRRFS